MKKPELFDVIELLTDIPEKNLKKVIKEVDRLDFDEQLDLILDLIGNNFKYAIYSFV